MATAFSWKRNDKKAAIIVRALKAKFTNGFNIDDLHHHIAATCDLSYEQVQTLLNRLSPIKGESFDFIRLAYAILHYKNTSFSRTVAHGKIIKVTTSGGDNPKLMLTILAVSSSRAGEIFLAQLSLREAIALQKKIYTGRFKHLQGRALLELTGCQLTVKVDNRAVVRTGASPSEKDYNRKLCKARILAEQECGKAVSCVLCRKTRSECKLAVR